METPEVHTPHVSHSRRRYRLGLPPWLELVVAIKALVTSQFDRDRDPPRPHDGKAGPRQFGPIPDLNSERGTDAERPRLSH